MKFYAFIIPGSDVDQLWKSERRVIGTLSNVRFKYRMRMHRYESMGELSGADVERLKPLRAVQLQAHSLSPVSPSPPIP